MEYIERQWITSSFYRPERWSIFSREVRTNNDLKGWHRRLNNNARRGQIQLYLLVGLLCKEGSFVTIQSRLVSEGKLKRHQRKKYRGLQSKLRIQPPEDHSITAVVCLQSPDQPVVILDNMCFRTVCNFVYFIVL